MQKDLDYIFILKALKEIPFGIGKKLLIDFLQGEDSNKSIQRNKLDSYENFGSLAYTKNELNSMIDKLILNNMIQLTSIKGNKFWKVMELSETGRKEMDSPSLYKRKSAYGFKEIKTKITEQDKKAFEALDNFLGKFNDFQKKGIISVDKKILCIAGAGSGKTTVLTKRIEFLVNYRSQDPNKILAITFTRKARQEMLTRLSKAQNLELVHVETFNSFCEKILRQHASLLYTRPVRVINFRDKISVLNRSLQSLKISMDKAVDLYFSYAQQRGKTPEQLSNILLNDVFFLRDYFKFKNIPIEETSFNITSEHKNSFKMVFGICNYIESYMKKYGYRDFADQLIDALSLFKSHKDTIPNFDHILIDEYQDVNSTQMRLVDMLNAPNLFCVGDPRQSIYGWRGSDLRYILNFEEKNPGSSIITLTKNYRSTEHIVKLINSSIKNLGLPDIESEAKGEKDIQLLKFDSENQEFEFVIQKILAATIPLSEIFVLARTNRQLTELSQHMKLRRIKHVVKSDELRKTGTAAKDEVTLATIHAIKGMEAKTVFVLGCSSYHFPSKGSEHPVIDMVKVEEYDKEEEERRLFYVAMSRAKSTLYLSYTGSSHSYFITDQMLSLLEEKKVEVKLNTAQKNISNRSNDIITRLKDWRGQLSKETNLPAYLIMHDRTLIDISIKMPTTTRELEDIHGLGPTKIMKYGEQILDIIS